MSRRVIRVEGRKIASAFWQVPPEFEERPSDIGNTTRSRRYTAPCKRPETIYFLGFTLYCTLNRKGNFRIGMRTEKSRLRRALMRLQEQMRLMRHSPLPEQVNHLNQMLRGHDAYYGIAGNLRSLLKVHRAVERYWRKMLSSRSWHGTVRWEQFQQIKSQFPLLKPKLHLSYPELQAIAKL